MHNPFRSASVLEIHDLISACHDQFGFCKGYSTTHLLLETTHDWAKALEYCGSCHCLCLDLAKAFDSVPHHWLMLKSLSVSGQLLEWIRCFLTIRSQRVIVNGHFSKWLPLSLECFRVLSWDCCFLFYTMMMTGVLLTIHLFFTLFTSFNL